MKSILNEAVIKICIFYYKKIIVKNFLKILCRYEDGIDFLKHVSLSRISNETEGKGFP
jgi:hypothetical protein